MTSHLLEKMPRRRNQKKLVIYCLSSLSSIASWMYTWSGGGKKKKKKKKKEKQYCVTKQQF